jgi:PPIC-type PPIASE domain
MRLLREPLLHFLLLGAGLFVVFGLVNKGTNVEPGKIVVTAGQIEHLTVGFTRTWQRPPTEQELEGLIQDNIREEVFYREAIALGLDRDDIVIRRRLRQKMEFIADDLAARVEPTDEELRAFLAKHPDTFRVEQRFTFSHVYLNPERRGEALQQDVERLLIELNTSAGATEVATLGDSFLLDHEFTATSRSEVDRAFGQRFAAQLSHLEPGTWQGPVASGYGVHLVFIRERAEGWIPALDDVREAVHREWANAQRLEANARFYERLRQRYIVTVEQPERSGGTAAMAAEAPR